MTKVPARLKKGDIVAVHWADICGNPVGTFEEAELARCITVGYFMGTKTDRGIECVVTCSTQGRRQGGDQYDGTDIYPLSIVERIELVRRAK